MVSYQYYDTLQNHGKNGSSPDSDTNFFHIVTVVLQWDTFELFMFIICLDYIL